MTLSRRPVFTQSNESQPTPPIPTLRRQTRTRRPRPRSVYSSPPNVAPRESSLYLPADGSNSPYNTSVTFPARHSYPPASASCFNIPQYAFFDTQAHIDIWEELFVSAHHTTKARVQRDQKERNRLTSAIVLGSTMPGEESKLLEKALKGLGMRSEIWSKTYEEPVSDMPSPAVPPRSRLRSTAPPMPAERNSSLYLLPVDQPLVQPSDDTPSLSSGSSSEIESPNPIVSPTTDTVRFGRKSRGFDRDPYKVRNGADAKRSTSGVYTPTTFPGAEGPRPSHFPSHVYTPTGFTLHPTAPRPTPNNYAYNPSAGPSRSTSMSSSTSGPDSSPVTPTGRLSRVAGKTLAGLRRISNQVTPVVSMRDSYFPPLSARSVHSRESSAGPTTPTSATRIRGLETPSSYFPPESPAGLGMGLSDDSQTSWSSKGTVLLSDTPTAELSRSPQPQARGRRKPVPKMFDGDLMDGIATLQVEEAHAM